MGEGEGWKPWRRRLHEMFCSARLENLLSYLFLCLIYLLSTWDSGLETCNNIQLVIWVNVLILWHLGIMNIVYEKTNHQLHLKQRTVTKIWRSVVPGNQVEKRGFRGVWCGFTPGKNRAKGTQKWKNEWMLVETSYDAAVD